MIENTIQYEINQLPLDLKQEVLKYIVFLKNEYLVTQNNTELEKRVFGRVKGKYKLSPDFDEHLEEFKEYM